VHLALAESSRSWTPAWLVEGTAVYFSSETYQERPDLLLRAMTAGLSLRDLSTRTVLRSEKSDSLELHFQYMLSTYTTFWIAKNFGEAKLLALYRAFGEEFPTAWRGANGGFNYADETGPTKNAERLKLTELLLKKHLGITVDQLQQEVQRVLHR
jgi:hypothetical protein